MNRVLARLEGIERHFGSVVALDGANLELVAGEVHAVLGANGAGKTTLLGILAGMLRPHGGLVEIDGRAVSLTGPRQAWEHGVGMVHQHFTLVPTLTVAENLALGVRGRSAAALRSDVARVVERTGLSVPLGREVESLGVGDRQRVEILKTLLRDPRVLVLDEPTAVLTPTEVDGLFAMVQEFAAEGRAVALVVHKLDEALGVADRITVLREGRTVLTGLRGEHPVGEIVRAMVGEGPRDAIAIGTAEPSSAQTASGSVVLGDVVARIEGVRLDVAGTRKLDGVDLVVRAGEIVGVVGVEGNGQHELAWILSDRRRPDSGVASLPPGIGFIPQDRTTQGVIAAFDLTENVALALHRRAEYRDGARLRWGALRTAAEDVRRHHGVTAPSVATLAGALSGGNQQRVVVGREIGMAEQLLVAENPTRGLDIAAAAFVHEELRRLAAQGVAVVLVGTDLDEVLALSSRVYAMARGRLVEVPPERRTREAVGTLMLAGDESDEHATRGARGRP